MINRTLKMIDALFDKTYGYVKDRLGDDINEEEYYTYLSNLYGGYFEEIAPDESDEKIKELIDCYVKIELMCFERNFNYG